MTSCFPSRTIILATLVACGCATRGNIDLLEGRLRHREDELFTLESELESARSELTVARQEADALRGQLNQRGEKTLLSEQADVLYRVQGVRVNKLLSGGLDRDDHPGDDLLNAFFSPHDAAGAVLKLPGSVQIELLDLKQPNGHQQIGIWNFDVEESRRHWHSGFLGSGYLFRLPWQQIPTNATLLLHVRLTAPDGRVFDASEHVRVTPPEPAPELARDDEWSKSKTEQHPNEPDMLRRIVDEKEIKPPKKLPEPESDGSDSNDTTEPRRTSDNWTGETIPRLR